MPRLPFGGAGPAAVAIGYYGGGGLSVALARRSSFGNEGGKPAPTA